MPPELNPDDPHQVVQALRGLAARLARNPLRASDARLIRAAVRHIDTGAGPLTHLLVVADCHTWSVQHPIPCQPGPLAAACPVGAAVSKYFDSAGRNAIREGRYTVSLSADGTAAQFTPLRGRHA